MSYMNIENLYKARTILEFKQCYAMEKIHGTSAHISWNDGRVRFFAGGVAHETFVKLFDQSALAERFRALGHNKVIVYGEAYGGACQKMQETYGPALDFVAFEVNIDGLWLSVPDAESVVNNLGLEFVYYKLIDTDLTNLNQERDADSVQAIRNCMGPGHMREGIVLRPPFECTMNNGARIIAKHKRDEFQETKTPRSLDPGKLQVLADADQIAEEWVTEMRLTHILDALVPQTTDLDIRQTGAVIKAMIEDIEREAAGEIEDKTLGRATRTAIGKRTAALFHQRIKKYMEETNGPGK